jgi:hypothetical protein
VGAENDLFGNGADHDYTHGTDINYVSEPCSLEWVRHVAQALWLAPRGVDCARTRVSLGLGQAIYTPSDIKAETPDPNDRPYAGWTYATFGLISEDLDPSGLTPHGGTTQRALKKVELSLGIVGPDSGAEMVQRNFHKAIGAQEPRGWSHQLEDEPAVMLNLEYQRRFGWHLGKVLQADATPSGTISLGNVFTEGGVALTFRLGQDMLSDYGPPRIRPSLPGAAFFQRPDSGFGWYIFGGIGGTLVGRNIFLDGNTFQNGPHVDKNNLVGDAQFGLAVTLGGVRLSYTNIFRTREFTAQPKPDNFGAITLSVHM